MKPFVHDDFLLETETARDLYHRVAKDLPVIDYHCHLSPELMAADHRFRSITEVWLEGDHYKWRAMRTNGVAERFCTGDASDWEKFEAWARTVPDTLGNPLYHWTHMELRRPFGIETLLSPATARATFDRANERLKEDGFTAMGLLKQFRVAVVCSTDDPTDTLEPHAKLAQRKDPDTQVFPTWRPDKALLRRGPPGVDRLAREAGEGRRRLDRDLGRAPRRPREAPLVLPRARLPRLRPRPGDRRRRAVHRRGGGGALRPAPGREGARGRGGAGLPLGPPPPPGPPRPRARLGAAVPRGRDAQQQHAHEEAPGPRHRLRLDRGLRAGPRRLARFLDRLDETDQLAKTILYNLNPADNELMATMIGNFQDGSVPGKMQWGSAWWFLDQLDGMEAQMRVLASMGLLSRFVGMITDSRSFLSYPRHDYFRRLLCNILGEDVRRGRLPDDRKALGNLVANVSFYNARDYFGFGLGRVAGEHAKAPRPA